MLAALAARRITREPIADAGVSYIRRASEAGHDYFFANLGADAHDGWVALGVAAGAAAILDPLTGATGAAALGTGEAGQARIDLQLAPGESLIVRTTRSGSAPAHAWPYREPAGEPIPLEGTWSIEFV